MYGLASSLFWVFADPARLIPGLGILGAVLLWTPWRRTGRWVVTLGAVGMVAVATLPVGRWVAGPLEYRFPPYQSVLPAVDGIIVLGAGAAVTSHLTGRPIVEASGQRLVKLIELAQQYPAARLVYTGGGTAGSDEPATEAALAARDLAAVDFDVSRLILEDRSRNTRDNAVLTKALVHPQAGETWLLITSAIHMPRSVGSFRAAGWQVTPVPVEYLYPPGSRFQWGFDPIHRFVEVSRITHEWVGLVVYRLLGRSSALLPAPQASSYTCLGAYIPACVKAPSPPA